MMVVRGDNGGFEEAPTEPLMVLAISYKQDAPLEQINCIALTPQESPVYRYQ
jgi:hypothetical protein